MKITNNDSPVFTKEDDIDIAEFAVDCPCKIMSYSREKDYIFVEIPNEQTKKKFFLSRNGIHIDIMIPTDNKNIDLQLTACFKGGVFVAGYVDGAGTPRKDAIPFSEARRQSIELSESVFENE